MPKLSEDLEMTAAPFCQIRRKIKGMGRTSLVAFADFNDAFTMYVLLRSAKWGLMTREKRSDGQDNYAK